MYFMLVKFNIYFFLQVFFCNFVQLEFDDLVLNYNSKFDFYLNIGDIDLVFELVSGVFFNFNYENYEVIYLGNDLSVYELQKKVRFVFVFNFIFLVCLGGILGEFD